MVRIKIWMNVAHETFCTCTAGGKRRRVLLLKLDNIMCVPSENLFTMFNQIGIK